MWALMTECEPINFAALAPHTMLDRRPAFTARPPEVSPIEGLIMERNSRMARMLTEAVADAAAEGVPASRDALRSFVDFVKLLPADVPVTDPYISARGSICMDWDDDPRYQLSVVLKDRDTLGFAAYLDGRRCTGSESFSRGELPLAFRSVIKDWSERARA